MWGLGLNPPNKVGNPLLWQGSLNCANSIYKNSQDEVNEEEEREKTNNRKKRFLIKPDSLCVQIKWR
jgi:hypothetical protein